MGWLLEILPTIRTRKFREELSIPEYYVYRLYQKYVKKKLKA